MIKTKVAFLEDRLFSSQSEQLFEYFLNCSNWLEKKPALQKSHFRFDHVNRVVEASITQLKGCLLDCFDWKVNCYVVLETLLLACRVM